MSSELVLATGVSGHTGSHVLERPLKEGYRVRGVARSRKADALRKVYAKYGDKVDIVIVEDLVKGDFADALKCVSAVIHVATPMPGHEELRDILERGGAQPIVRQAVTAGVKHISFAGSVAAFMDLSSPVIKAPLSDKDWNPVTEEHSLDSGNGILVCGVAKTQAEQALWKFAEGHPGLGLTTVSPTSFMGPFAEDFIITPGNVSGLSTSVSVYSYFAGPEKTFYTLPMGHVDTTTVCSSLEWFDLADAIKHIAATRPELAPRLVKTGFTGQTRPIIDNKKALEVVRITLTPWKKTIEDGVDGFLKLEKDWAEKGIDLTPLRDNQ